jgi:hypothetical protein
MNIDLNKFKKLSEKEKLSEVSKLEFHFPAAWPSTFSDADKRNLYIGRIISILDEFGETEDWHKYAGGVNIEKIEENYCGLIIRYLKEFKPEILDYYKEYYGICD